MSQATIEAHYRPNWNLSQAMGFTGYNCGFTEERGSRSFAEHQQALVWRLLGDVAIGRSDTVLDIGCGIGGPTGWLFERFHPMQIIGLEYCRSSVVAAEGRWAGVSERPWFLQGDAHALPAESGTVDVIFNLESALHYVNKPVFLSECQRVLRAGGRLCIGDITAPNKLLFSPLTLLNSWPSQFNSNIRLWSADDYVTGFAKAGLRLVRHENVARQVADSLGDGMVEIRHRGWAANKGFRARIMYLVILEKLFRGGQLGYDLFELVRD
ncbi:MAG: methyltransferase domain-containing protein [Planctomycetota bacterium]